MEITSQAMAPGKYNRKNRGNVTTYKTPAHSTERMRQEKWLACQVPAASGFFTRSITSAMTSNAMLGWA